MNLSKFCNLKIKINKLIRKPLTVSGFPTITQNVFSPGCFITSAECRSKIFVISNESSSSSPFITQNSFPWKSRDKRVTSIFFMEPISSYTVTADEVLRIFGFSSSDPSSALCMSATVAFLLVNFCTGAVS